MLLFCQDHCEIGRRGAQIYIVHRKWKHLQLPQSDHVCAVLPQKPPKNKRQDTVYIRIPVYTKLICCGPTCGFEVFFQTGPGRLGFLGAHRVQGTNKYRVPMGTSTAQPRFRPSEAWPPRNNARGRAPTRSVGRSRATRFDDTR